MGYVDLALRRLIGLMALLGLLSFGCGALVTLADVVGRLVGLPVRGVVDLVQLFMVTGAWMSIPFAFLKSSHVGVDLVVRTLPRTLRAVAGFLAVVAAIILLGLMAFYGFETFQRLVMFGDKSQQLGIPIEIYWYPIFLGLAMSLVGAVLSFLTSLNPETANV